MNKNFEEYDWVIIGSGFGGSVSALRPHHAFYSRGNWAGLADWERELGPHYAEAERLVKTVQSDGKADGSEGYLITHQSITSWRKKKQTVRTKGVIFSGGVPGTVRLLLDMKKKDFLPDLLPEVGDHVRADNENLTLVVTKKSDKDYSKGIAICSIFPPNEDGHIEPVRYSALKLKRRLFKLNSSISRGEKATPFIDEAEKLAKKTAEIIDGIPLMLSADILTGAPSTAYILGGAVIGDTPEKGVIDTDQKVFGYKNMLVCDGSAVSANPGVNPSLTITAITERAMSKIPAST